MNKKQKIKLMRILAGVVLFGAAYLPAPFAWYKPAVFTLALLASGGDILWNAASKLIRGRMFDEDLLMSIAAVGAFAIGEFPEGVLVLTLAQTGEFFESYAVGRSRNAIKSMMALKPDKATVIRGGASAEVDAEDVSIGEIIMVAPGERIPLDGVVISGESALDTSALTGESLPRELYTGDNAMSGCVNLTGRVEIEVTRRAGESTAARVLALIEDAAAQKAKQEKFITRFARVYTPAVVVAAIMVALLPPLITGGAWNTWIYRALTFLVVSCPCALVISVPLSFFGGIGGASKKGILIKGGVCLETLARAGCAVFDKTGTLTQGAFQVTKVTPEGISEAKLLELAALAESASSHPIARSILEAHGNTPDAARVSAITEHAGYGVSAEVDGMRVLCGTPRFLKREGVDCPRESDDETGVLLALNGVYAGSIELADKPKPGAKAAIDELKALGISNIVMLTGDREGAATRIAGKLGITDVRAGLLPDGKVDMTRKIKAALKGDRTLLYAGDGINDAPVLSLADTGIAMGALGADAAIEAADVVIMDDNPQKIPLAIRLARRTMTIARANICFALGVKALALVLSMLGVTGMWEAVFADVGVSVLAILNAARTLKVK